MTGLDVNTLLRKKRMRRSLRSRMADALFVGANSIINAWQLTTITRLAWCGACSVYTAIVGWDDSLILVCAFGMRLLTSKKLMKLGPKL